MRAEFPPPPLDRKATLALALEPGLALALAWAGAPALVQVQVQERCRRSQPGPRGASCCFFFVQLSCLRTS